MYIAYGALFANLFLDRYVRRRPKHKGAAKGALLGGSSGASSGQRGLHGVGNAGSSTGGGGAVKRACHTGSGAVSAAGEDVLGFGGCRAALSSIKLV